MRLRKGAVYTTLEQKPKEEKFKTTQKGHRCMHLCVFVRARERCFHRCSKCGKVM